MYSTLIKAAQGFFEKYCCRNSFDESEVTEYYDGGKSTVFLKQPPIKSDGNVDVWDDPNRDFDSTTEVASDDYGIDYDNGVLEFDYTLSVGRRSVKVTYTGGYAKDAIPQDLRQACVMQVIYKFKELKRGELGVPSRTLPDGSVTLTVVDLLPQVKAVLDLYRLPNSH